MSSRTLPSTAAAAPSVPLRASHLYSRFEAVADGLRSPLLLVVRLYWGWQFVQTGWGKLSHLGRTGDYFASLGIPAPAANALAAGCVETLGGFLLLIGLGARLASLPLIVTLAVAYGTAEREALAAVFRDPDQFTGAAPFLFLLAASLVLAFGPGAFSLDRLLRPKKSVERKT